MGQNKTGKYFKYAIGEILLVMIGILLALQVNNWNEGRKNRIVEHELLFNIKHAFQADIENNIDNNMLRCNQRIVLTSALIKAANIDNSFPDSLQSKYIWLGLQLDFRPNATSFKELESRGHAIISNKELRYSIINLHAEEYLSIQTSFQNEVHNLREVYRPEIRKYFKINPVNIKQYFEEDAPEKIVYNPIAFKEMINDMQFMNAITIMHNNNVFMKSKLEELKKNINIVIKQIEDELLK